MILENIINPSLANHGAQKLGKKYKITCRKSKLNDDIYLVKYCCLPLRGYYINFLLLLLLGILVNLITYLICNKRTISQHRFLLKQPASEAMVIIIDKCEIWLFYRSFGSRKGDNSRIVNSGGVIGVTVYIFFSDNLFLMVYGGDDFFRSNFFLYWFKLYQSFKLVQLVT